MVRGRIVFAAVVLLGMTALSVQGYLNERMDPSYVTMNRSGFTPIDIVLEVAPAWAFGLAGLIAWHRRPSNRIGPLMLVVAALLLTTGFQALPIPPLVSLGQWIGEGLPSSIVLTAVLVLMYPRGQLASTGDRIWTAAAASYVLVPTLALTLVSPATNADCIECRSWFILSYHEPVQRFLANVNMVLAAGLTIAYIGVIVRRWLAATQPARHASGALWLASIIVLATAVVEAAVNDAAYGQREGTGYVVVPSLGALLYGRISPEVSAFLPWLVATSLLLVPAALLWGVLRSHLGHAAVTALAIELRRPGPGVPLIESLRRALGDRSLELALWSRPAAGYITPAGLPMSLPDEGHGRAVTRLGSSDEDDPLAALIHDPALKEQETLFEGVSAVAQLAIENERLHAEVREQLEQVRASRQRIVQATDEERRRVERDIHDGAQQRLVSLSLALGLARAQAADASPQLVATIAEAEAELRGAIGDLRQLARGIHPAILTEAGLGPALESLVEHSPISVALETDLNGRLPPVVEATAYFVAAEALTNVAKHTAATTVRLSASVADGWLLLSVADDGGGGANLDQGTGLRGLLDRVSALGGSFLIESDGAHGTSIMARIPCG